MTKGSLLGSAKLTPIIAGGLALAAVLVISNMAVAPLQIAFSQNQSASVVPASNMVIEAIGEASMALEPDQVTLVLGKQSRLVNSSEIVEIQNSDSDAVVSAIKSVLEDDTSTVVAAGFYLNPFSGRPFPLPNPSQTYTANINTAIQIAPDDLAEAADKIADAGFSVESIYLSSSMYPSPFPYGYGYSEDAESSDAANVGGQNGTDSLITLSLAVASESDTLENIMNKYEELSDRLDALLQDLGVEASQPPTASFYPSYYDGVIPPYPSSQYTLHSQVIVKTDPANVDMVVQAAGGQGAYLQSLSLSFSDALLDEARIQLNQQALENAKERANEMGASLGLEVQSVRSISIGGSGNELADLPLYRGVSLSSLFPFSGMPSEEISVALTAEFEMG